MTRTDRFSFVFVVCLSLLLAVPSGAAEGVGAFRLKLDKWVESQQILSAENTDWKVEREYLEATNDLLGQERRALEQEIAELQESNTAADEERRLLLLEKAECQRASTSLESEIAEMEQAVVGLVPLLPDPLQQRLTPLLVQIPKDSENGRSPVGQRLMNVLGILAQAEKFNSAATFVGETRSLDGERRVGVRTLYWGLGQAIYVDAQGKQAGIGRPGPEGWEFAGSPELASDAKQLLDIYEGNVDDIEFVLLPVQIR